MSGPKNILVIKHGAFGDIVLATAGFAAIRAHHPHAHIICLTTKPYAELLAASPYFNKIWVDSKPRFADFKAIGRLRTMLNSRKWEWVYDLQTSTRSKAYQWLIKHPWPKISNTSRFTSHGYTDPARHKNHALESIRAQLKIAGIADVGMPDLSWLAADISDIRPQGLYALFAPGTSPKRFAERWPAEKYAALAQELVAKKMTPVLIGTNVEAEVLDSIAARVPQALNLCGKTSFAQLATLARGATLAVGNNTGPMHIIGASNCPSLVLFNYKTNPEIARPMGASVQTIRVPDLRDLSVDRVLVALQAQA